MTEKLTLRLPVHIIANISGNATDEERLLAACGGVDASATDLATILFFLCHDRNPDVKTTAADTLRSLPDETAVAIAGDRTAHPKILDIVARLYWSIQDVAEHLAVNASLAQETVAFLADHGVAYRVQETVPKEPEATKDDAESKEEEVDEESEEFKSKYQQAQTMGISEKIKAGLTGDKEWRMILIKDSNKLVSGSVIKNPRITEPEVLAISKSAIQNDEVIRLICTNKEWVKNYQIRKSLVVNSKTPLPFALRFMDGLTEKDLASLAKSKNVSTVVSTQARRVLQNKQKRS